MPILFASAEPKWATLRAVVTRADGTVEDRGIVAFRHRNALINALGGLWIAAFAALKRARFGRDRELARQIRQMRRQQRTSQ